jgi:hypothetical protein
VQVAQVPGQQVSAVCIPSVQASKVASNPSVSNVMVRVVTACL